VRCDRGLSAAETRALAKWQAADPRHAAEFARLGGAWRSLDDLSAAPQLTALADTILVRAARDAPGGAP